MTGLTRQRVLEVLRYDPDGGRFFWIDPTSNRVFAGDQAGSLGINGYWSIGIDGRRYYEHRLVWLCERGEWPAAHLDHADGNKWNNRIGNLREATVSQNIANARLNEANTSGCKGVSFNKRLGRWHAYIGIGGHRKHLGCHGSRDDAAAAYDAAAIAAFGPFARINNLENRP